MNRLALIAQANSHKATVVYDDITFVAVGAAASGTTSATPGNPTVANGDLLLMNCSSKLQTHHVTTPTAYRRLAEGDLVASTASNGGDLGPIRQTIFMKETNGTEAATETVSLPSGNSLNAAIYALRKDAQAKWQILVSGGAHNTPNLTAYEAVSFHKMASKVGDVYVIFTSINTDLYPFTDQALAQTGNTFEVVNQDVGEFSTTAGNDSEQFASIFRVTAVTDINPLKLTFTATSGGSAAGNPIGVTHFVRLRQIPNVETLPPSGLRVWRASEIVQTTYSGDGSSIWDGQRTSYEQTGTVAEKYSIETVGGRPCFRFHAQLVDSSNYSRRAEVSHPIPWQPAYGLGVEKIHEWKFITPVGVCF